MKAQYFALLFLFALGGCSSVPSVQLDKENFEQLQTIRIESNPDNNSMLHAVSTVEVQLIGQFPTGNAGDGMGLRELTLKYMDDQQVSLNEMIRHQFIEKVKADNLKVIFDQNSDNKLIMTINVAVLGRVHGFSDEFSARFNIAGQLFDGSGALIWSYNAVPSSPLAPGYSVKLEDLFSSKEAMLDFFEAASDESVQKLYDNFKRNLNE
jgi:hypothetical protein